MKRGTVAGDAGTEVGLSMVPRARVLVGPGVPRAPQIAAPARPVSASFRFRGMGTPRQRPTAWRRLMEVLYPRCAGLDVHARSVTACVRIASGPDVTYQHRTVPTTTRGLLELADWLAAAQCTHVAMEATGVYWKPVWHLLDGHFRLVLANALHIRHVPGRKSDMTDA